jgi:prepilin-type processing-associated H-X9-DG protein
MITSQQSPSRSQVRGISLAEICVAVGLIALLIAMLFPIVRSVRAEAHFVVCKASMLEVGRKMFPNGTVEIDRLIAASQWGEPIVNSVGWPQPERGDWVARLFAPGRAPTCPAAIREHPMDQITSVYAINHRAYLFFNKIRPRRLVSHSQIVVLAESRLMSTEHRGPLFSDPGSTGHGFPLLPDGYENWAYDFDPIRHGRSRGSNFLFADLHVSNDQPYRDSPEIYPLDIR